MEAGCEAMAASPQKQPVCPECRAPTTGAFRPFCSKRCADVDLARWLTGGYAIPAAKYTGDAEDDSSSAPDTPPH